MEQKCLHLRREDLIDSDRLGLRATEDGEGLLLWAFVSPDHWEIFEITQQDNVLWAWQSASGKSVLRPGNQWSDIVAYVAVPRHVSDAASAAGLVLPDVVAETGPEDLLSELRRLGWKTARWHADQEHVWVQPYYLNRAQAAKLVVECLTYNKNAANFPSERLREYADFGPFER